MLSDLPLFRIYGAMAQHAAETQRVSAENIARAGEPGYKAMAVEPFEAYMEKLSQASGSPPEFAISTAATPVSPNGNSVSLEHEIFKSAEAGGQHNMALSVYSKSMQLMKMAIGRR